MNNKMALATILRNPERGGTHPAELFALFWKDTPSFRFYILSECAGLVASSFWLVALPWLAVHLSGSPTALGTVVLLSGIGRVSLVLPGGMLSDQFSPHTMLWVAGAGRALLFMALVLGGLHSLASVYACALAWGILDAIGLPARGTLLPRLVADHNLPTANALLQGLEKLCGVLGPLLAGWALGSASAASGAGVATAFSASGVLAVLALVCLGRVRPEIQAAPPHPVRPDRAPGSISLARLPQRLWESQWEPLSAIWSSKGLRAAVWSVLAMNILTAGPLAIGLPGLVVQRFGNHAWLLGLLSSIIAAAGLLGSMLSGRCPLGQVKRIGILAPAAFCGLSLATAGAGITGNVAGLAVGLFAFCTLTSYLTLGYITYLQRNAPPEYLGRLMGLLNLK
jgi:MFS family permease